MDAARKRFADNVELLKSFNPDMVVMGDREWTDTKCTNPYIQHMAKKLWMHNLTDAEVLSLNKAVTGYLMIEKRIAEAEPIQTGGRVVKGQIVSVKKTCDHEDCLKHYRVNVRDAQYKNTVYTPIPANVFREWVGDSSEQELVGRDISFYAHISVSDRDETFGFAHKPKLMTIEKEGT